MSERVVITEIDPNVRLEDDLMAGLAKFLLGISDVEVDSTPKDFEETSDFEEAATTADSDPIFSVDPGFEPRYWEVDFDGNTDAFRGLVDNDQDKYEATELQDDTVEDEFSRFAWFDSGDLDEHTNGATLKKDAFKKYQQQIIKPDTEAPQLFDVSSDTSVDQVLSDMFTVAETQTTQLIESSTQSVSFRPQESMPAEPIRSVAESRAKPPQVKTTPEKRSLKNRLMMVGAAVVSAVGIIGGLLAWNTKDGADETNQARTIQNISLNTTTTTAYPPQAEGAKSIAVEISKPNLEEVEARGTQTSYPLTVTIDKQGQDLFNTIQDQITGEHGQKIDEDPKVKKFTDKVIRIINEQNKSRTGKYRDLNKVYLGEEFNIGLDTEMQIRLLDIAHKYADKTKLFSQPVISSDTIVGNG